MTANTPDVLTLDGLVEAMTEALGGVVTQEKNSVEDKRIVFGSDSDRQSIDSVEAAVLAYCEMFGCEVLVIQKKSSGPQRVDLLDCQIQDTDGRQLSLVITGYLERIDVRLRVLIAAR